MGSSFIGLWAEARVPGQAEGRQEGVRKLAPLLLPGSWSYKAHPVRTLKLWPVSGAGPCSHAYTSTGGLQLPPADAYPQSSVPCTETAGCPSIDPTTQAPPVELLHSISVHLPFRSVSNTLSDCHLQSLVTIVLQHINILSQHLEYPHSTALPSWGRKWLKAVGMQPKGLQFRRVLSYCTIVLYFCFQSWFRVLVRV